MKCFHLSALVFSSVLLSNSGCRSNDQDDSLGIGHNVNEHVYSEQPRIVVERVPHLTPLFDPIYLAGAPNNWDAQDAQYAFEPAGFLQYQLHLPEGTQNFEYKITRGSWESVETKANGGFKANRIYTPESQTNSQYITIEGWEDQDQNSSTASDNVHIISNVFEIPQLNKTRRVWVYLPPDYHQSNRSYPVIYLLDGQAAFDQNTSPFGEWEVDEALNNLANGGDPGAIVVAVDHGESDRINEYSPWVNAEYGGGQGVAFSKFLVNTLKPFVDEHFRTKTSASNTAIAGSSMGGLMSLYAATQYPHVFGKALIFSPALWFAEAELESHLQNSTIPASSKFYLMSGTSESGSMVPLMQQAKNILMQKGVSSHNINLITHSDGAHSEWFWAREFKHAYQWLF